MAAYGDGRWKEGRHGAASLCYDGIGGEALAWVAAHHARVGIRATLVTRGDEAIHATLAGRNWELASAPPDGTAAPAGAAEAQAAIAAVAEAGGWGIWRIDAAALAAWGADGHSRLLGWLGSQHARIWCAPRRDIAAWRDAQPPASSTTTPL